MKKFFLLLLLSSPALLQAQTTTGTPVSVPAAQARVWEIGQKLNAAVFNLNVMKLDWQRGKLTELLTQAQTADDTSAVTKIQAKIAEIDRRKILEKQKSDLNDQLIQARQQGDQGKVDAVIFQLRNLQ